MIQAGLPIGQFAAMPGLMEEVAWEEEIGNSRVLREPVGVLGAITPWNYPLNQIAAKVAPALAAGCTVVLKPSEVVPLNAFILAEVIEAAGLPAGVFNLVTGTGPVVGEAIAGHPGVDMVSFTGSTRAGRRVSELASATVKPVAMELGGKSPNVILDDADLRQGGARRRRQVLPQLGPDLQRPDPDAGPAREARRSRGDRRRRRRRASPPAIPSRSRPGSGPLVSEVQRERVRGYIEKGEAGGREARHRRRRAARGPRARLLRPPHRLLRGDAGDDDRPGGDLRAGALDPALRRTRTTRCGSPTTPTTASPAASGRRDQERAIGVAKRIRTGQIEINGGAFNPLAPFGGYKQSGHGRENGRYAIEELLQVKSRCSFSGRRAGPVVGGALLALRSAPARDESWLSATLALPDSAQAEDTPTRLHPRDNRNRLPRVNFELTDEQRLLRDTVRDFARERGERRWPRSWTGRSASPTRSSRSWAGWG